MNDALEAVREADSARRCDLKVIIEDAVKKLTNHQGNEHCCHQCDHFTDEHGDHGEVTGHACMLISPIMWMKTKPTSRCNHWQMTPGRQPR